MSLVGKYKEMCRSLLILGFASIPLVELYAGVFAKSCLGDVTVLASHKGIEAAPG